MQLYTRAPFSLRLEHNIPCENETESRLFYAKVIVDGAEHLPHEGGILYEQINIKVPENSPRQQRFNVNDAWFYIPLTMQIYRYEEFLEAYRFNLIQLGFYNSIVTQRIVTQQNASPLATVEILQPGKEIDQHVCKPFGGASIAWKRLVFLPALEFYRFGWRNEIDLGNSVDYFKWNTYSDQGADLYELDFFPALLKEAEGCISEWKEGQTQFEWVAELSKCLDALITPDQLKDIHDFVSAYHHKIICDDRYIKSGRIAFNSPPSYARSVAILLNKHYYR